MNNIKQNFTLEKAFNLFKYYERIVKVDNVYIIKDPNIASLHISDNGANITYDHTNDVFLVDVPGYSEFLIPDISCISKIIKTINRLPSKESVLRYLSNNFKLILWFYVVHDEDGIDVLYKNFEKFVEPNLGKEMTTDFIEKTFTFTKYNSIKTLNFEIIYIKAQTGTKYMFSEIFDVYTFVKTLRLIQEL